MRRTYLLFLVLSLILFTNISYSQEKGFGLGVIIGEPTGINAKLWTSAGTALNFSLGYSFTSSNSLFDFYTDYVFHNPNLLQSEEKFVVYYGPGARLKINEHESRLGIRGVIGILWLPRETNFDLFVEAAPILDIVPETKFDFAGGIGGRYYFN